jgi:hypothetical protein
MTTSKVIIIASLSLLFSPVSYTMDLVEHQPSSSQKKALAALMFEGVLQAPESLKQHNPLLLHHDGDLHLIQKGKLSKIPFENVRGLKEKLTSEQLKEFLENGGYFWLSKNDQDDYFVEAKLRAFGGAVIGAQVGYVVGKGLGYGLYAFYTVTTHGEGIAHLHEAEIVSEYMGRVGQFIGAWTPW